MARCKGKQEKAAALSSTASDGDEEQAETLPLFALGKEEEPVARALSKEMAQSQAHEDEDDDDEEEELESELDEAQKREFFGGSAVQLGNGGLILVLFETPSGFAIFAYDGVKLLEPRAIEDIWVHFTKNHVAKQALWLMEFQTFEDKARAINIDTGVNEQLAKMIQKHIEPDQKLAVGSLKYKKIIEEHLGISCLFDDCVLELMWGLKNCMHHLVPGEELELAKEDRLQMSKGMKMVLDGYGFDVKPEMVNERIIEAACVVYNCDYCVDKHSESLRDAAKHLEEISGINPQGWSLMKIATALMMVCCPYQQLKTGDPREIFSKEVCVRLWKDAPKYEDRICKVSCSRVFDQMVWARGLRYKMLRVLANRVKEAREAYEVEQAMSSPSDLPREHTVPYGAASPIQGI